MDNRLKEIAERYQELERQLSEPDVISNQNAFRALTREHASISPLVHKIEEKIKAEKELLESRDLLGVERDPEMSALLKAEIEQLEERLGKLNEEIKVLLLPKDPNSGKDVIMEIRAGTGGDEAALFAADLFRMYNRYTDDKRWKLELMEVNQTEIGGFKEISFSISGDGAYDNLKYESGVHRVQRIPTTESGGRIHTSAVTVAVLPEAEESEIVINPEELRIDVYRSSGHGGQSVNTTDSAVRITHIPTGMVVTCQDEKSQLKNKVKAMRVLRARLLEIKEREDQEKESQMRRAQVGSGDRSERIRTYNFPQSRVTDHRINLTLYNLDAFLNGELDTVIEPMKKFEIEQLLKAKK
ncbi:MAG TPA: peptide chain release factor 1 [Spirochaetota bacterium]|nr:peptide chain release factor 1 [Spirochaetota bacterium]